MPNEPHSIVTSSTSSQIINLEGAEYYDNACEKRLDNSSQSGSNHAKKSKVQYSNNISTKETFEEFICATFPLSAKLSFSPAKEMIALEPQKDFPVSVMGKKTTYQIMRAGVVVV